MLPHVAPYLLLTDCPAEGVGAAAAFAEGLVIASAEFVDISQAGGEQE
jgi:hypothetical protein